MRSHVDWLTFTMPMLYLHDTPEDYANAISAGFLDMFGEENRARIFAGDWKHLERRRAPYSDAWQLEEQGMSIFASPTLTHCCVEISGRGCEFLIENTLLDIVLQHCRKRVTRIDVACDIETDVRPQAFVNAVSKKRMRASGYQNSESGETCYVGSQKSERYARVYRYAKPHPRSHLLRVEHVFRKGYAKIVCDAIVAAGVDVCARSAGDAFGWSHHCWQPEIGASMDVSVVSEERQMGKTVFWLVDTCAKSFRRLVREGVIKDPEAFLERYFLSDTIDA